VINSPVFYSTGIQIMLNTHVFGLYARVCAFTICVPRGLNRFFKRFGSKI
jgi:hypothetical protein